MSKTGSKQSKKNRLSKPVLKKEKKSGCKKPVLNFIFFKSGCQKPVLKKGKKIRMSKTGSKTEKKTSGCQILFVFRDCLFNI